VVSPEAAVLTLFLPAGFKQFYTKLGPTPWRDVECDQHRRPLQL
jgi:hypothetical protein